MDIQSLNENLSLGNVDDLKLFPHLNRLSQSPFNFKVDFGLEELPTEPGILLIRGARQYGKSTWLEQQLLKTIKTYGPGSAYYLNGDYIADVDSLEHSLATIAVSFRQDSEVKRIFIDEITNIRDWETVLKRMVDAGQLDNILIVTTGSNATDLRRGAERLPGRKGKLAQTNYLFTPISYRNFHNACHDTLGENTLTAYLLSGGSPIACNEIATSGTIPEYVIQLVRDWVEGEVAKSGRHRSTFINLLNVLFRFGGSPVGQAKLAREANLANNSVAQGYIELLNDLGCVVPSFPYDVQKQQLVLRKPCKYHYINLLVACAYHPKQPRSIEDFQSLPESVQAMWYEWSIAQELTRRAALDGRFVLEPLAFWQSKDRELDFVDNKNTFIEAKLGKSNPIEFAWFPKIFPKHKLTLINKNSFSTDFIDGVTLEQFLLNDE